MIAVVDYGIGNLRSAEKALSHIGAEARLVSDPDEVAAASAVVLPGVGAFGRCSEALRSTGLDHAVKEVVARGVGFLGICIGFQLLFEGSEEDPSAAGLGILGGVVRSIPAGEKRPQMQWNRLERTGSSRMLEGLGESPWMYFVHSYAPEPNASTAESVVATCDYGGSVVAAVEDGNVWGTQFHPEKSSGAGLALLQNFVGTFASEPRAVEPREAANSAMQG
jgi:imidazole glycerol-phosphate synthase subunit HisH